MSLTQKAIVLAKIESTYGTDASPSPSTDAILVANPSITITADRHELDYVRTSLSPVEFYIGARDVEVTFTTPLRNTGEVGTSAPEIGVLLRACGMSETINAGSDVTYEPVSSGFESATIYLYMDGVLHKVVGARGTFNIRIAMGEPATVEWTFRGKYVAPEDYTTIAGLSLDTTTSPPQALSATFSMGGTSYTISELLLGIGNELNRVGDITDATGISEIAITRRLPAGSFNPLVPSPDEATDPASKPWRDWLTNQTLALSVSIGTAGNQIDISAPKCQYDSVGYADREGLRAYDIPFTMLSDAGDDELVIVFK